MRELQILLQRLGFIVSCGNAIGMYDFFAQWGESDTAYVSSASRLSAPGWDAVDIVFGEDVPARMMRELEREMRDGYRFRYFTVMRVGGRRVWIMTLKRILKLSGVSGGAVPGPTPPTPDNTWLWIYMPNGGTISLNKVGSPQAVTLEVSYDDGQTWTTWVENGSARTATLSAGQVMHVRNTSDISTKFSIGTNNNHYKFSFDASANAGGNVNSLICKDPSSAVFQGNYSFASLFRDCSLLVTAPELPATTLAYGCYYYMFYNCTSLVTAPELPATTLASSCYAHMFRGCTSLVTAPELPATTLASSCYQNMFYDCTSLVTAPELPATTLAGNCYPYMFYNCTSLVTAPELPATTMAGNDYQYMFYGCTSLVTAPELPATTLANYCYAGMFGGCASLVTAPELPATTLANYCYQSMFFGCTSLVTAPELPATTLANYCYAGMFQGCTSLVNASELPATTLVQNCYTDMFNGCSSVATLKVLATTWNTSYTNNWVAGVAATGDFYCPSSLTIASGVRGIPSGWTRHDI